MVTKQILETLINESTAPKGRSSSKAHLKAAYFDWNKEQQWEENSAFILDYEMKGFIFFTFTKREPRHCTLRHIVTLEQHRGQGIASKLLEMMYTVMREQKVERLRFFADLPSIEFYEKLGYTWHGYSKTGLPFFYGTIDPIAKLDLPKAQQRFVKDS